MTALKNEENWRETIKVNKPKAIRPLIKPTTGIINGANPIRRPVHSSFGIGMIVKNAKAMTIEDKISIMSI